MIEIKISLQPKQKQFLRTIEKTPITFFGGAKGGGKSKGVRDIMLLRRFQYPKTHGGLFRKTYKELEGNHIRPIFKDFPELKQYYSETKKLLTLPNGSTLEFCHAQNEQDLDLYQGREFEDLAIEEAGQWTESMFRKLLGSNRSATPNFKPRCMLTGNPGGVGHTWLKRIFIERRFNKHEKPEQYAFIQALVDDNPALIENDPEYIARLESEPNEALRMAFRYGSWDIFAGQFFSELDRNVHVIKPFPIPRHWTKFGAYDFGFNHPAAFGAFACDEDGNIFLTHELIKAQMRVDQFAEEIKKLVHIDEFSPIVAGWDCWAKKSVLQSGSPPTVAEEFLNHGIQLNRAAIDRVQGAAQVRNYLAWRNLANGRNRPRFYIFDTCPISFDCLSRMEYDPKHPEDVLKVDATEGDPFSGDDAYDMIRYGLMTRPILAVQPQLRHPPGTKEWAHQQQKAIEDALQKQIDYQQAEENNEDIWAIQSMGDEEDALSYYINKRRR